MTNKQVSASCLSDLKDVDDESAKAIIANCSIKIQLRDENALALNPMQMGTPNELATMFASMAEVKLSDEQRETTIQVIKTLPEGASVKDFIDACDLRLAQDMGITPVKLQGLRPLLNALAAVSM